MSRARKSAVKQPAPVPERPAPEIPAGGGAKIGLLRLAQLQFLLALGISAYLAYGTLVRGQVAGCGTGSDCNLVLTSRWAYWFDLPVSLPATFFYGLLLTASAFAGPARAARTQARAWSVLIAGAFAVLGAALWFVGLQGAILGSWCPYCMGAHLLGGTGALLVLVAAPFVIRGLKGGEPLLFGVSQRAGPAVLGILALVPLVFGQFLSRPPSAAVATLGDGGSQTIATVATPAGKPSRQHTLHNGRFTIELYEAPLHGRPDAPHVVVSLFDYTCAHCRNQHALLERVRQTYAGELAIVALPMPLDAACNPLLARTGPDHVNACEYARIGMAVWRANPAAFAEYEHWFFEPAKPRPVAEARAKAIALTGRRDFAALEADPWIDTWLQLGRDVFKANWDQTGRNSLPMLMIGPALTFGIIQGEAELHDLIGRHLGLSRPATTATAP